MAKTLQLNLSKGDLKYLDMNLKNPAAPDASDGLNGSRNAVMQLGNASYLVKISRYSGQLGAERMSSPEAFDIRLEGGAGIDRIGAWHLLQPRGMSYKEMNDAYALADALGVYHPRTEPVGLEINGFGMGKHILRQRYDAAFLEKTRPGSIIFKLENAKSGPQVRFLFNEAPWPGAEAHVLNFAKQLQAKDGNILAKYFDLEYLARMEALMEMSGGEGGLIASDDTAFMYDTGNGMIYPLLDESSIANMHVQSAGMAGYIVSEMKSKPLVLALKKKIVDAMAGRNGTLQNTEWLAQYRGADSTGPAGEGNLGTVEAYTTTDNGYLDNMVLEPPIFVAKNAYNLPKSKENGDVKNVALADGGEWLSGGMPAIDETLDEARTRWENGNRTNDDSKDGPDYFEDFASGPDGETDWLRIKTMENEAGWGSYGGEYGTDFQVYAQGARGKWVGSKTTAYTYIPPENLTGYGQITAWVYSEQNGTGAYICLGTNHENKYYYMSSLKSGWNHIRVPKTMFSAGGRPDWSDITYLEVINTFETGAPIVFDNIRAGPDMGEFYDPKEGKKRWINEEGGWETQAIDGRTALVGMGMGGEEHLEYNRYIADDAVYRASLKLNGGKNIGYRIGGLAIGINGSGSVYCADESGVISATQAGEARENWVELTTITGSGNARAYFRTQDGGTATFLCAAAYRPDGEFSLTHDGHMQLFQDVVVYEPAPDRYGKLGMRLEGKTFVVPKGNYEVEGNLIIPIGEMLRIEAGTKIRMMENASWVSYSPIRIEGTEREPVVVRADTPDGKFGVFAVRANGNGKSVIRNLDLSGGSEAFVQGVFYSGGLDLYDTDAQIYGSRIHHNYADDGLNVKRGRVDIRDSRFYANYADQIDLDMCRGTVAGNEFSSSGGMRNGAGGGNADEDVNGDGLDLSGSQLLVVNNTIHDLKDKGISIGEKTRIAVLGNRIYGNRAGMAVKDLSEAASVGNDFEDNDYAMSAYLKKEVFGGGTIYSAENNLSGNRANYALDNSSGLYLLENGTAREWGGFSGRADAGGLDEAFDRLVGRAGVMDNPLLRLRIGGKDARIDEENKVIFANLPDGSGTVQEIEFKFKNEDTEAHLEPDPGKALAPGAGFLADTASPGARMANGMRYDFGRYVYEGTLSAQTCPQEGICKESRYKLYVTTGQVPILEIDTRDEYGREVQIPEEGGIPAKAMILSSQGADYEGKALEATINARGFYRGEKRKYSLELKYPEPVMGMESRRAWVLESSFIDASLMRNKIVSDLLGQFRTEDSAKPKRAAQGRFAEVFLDGGYNGVYLVTEKTDAEFFGFDTYKGKNETMPLLYKAENNNANYLDENQCIECYGDQYSAFPEGYQPRRKEADPIMGWHSGYSQAYPPEAKRGPEWGRLDEFIRFVATSQDFEFNARIEKELDVGSYIDHWIILNFVDNTDAVEVNKYLANGGGAGGKWFSVPYDFDGTLGRDWNMTKTGIDEWQRNNLLCRMMKKPGLAEEFAKRWQALREAGTISDANINGMIDENARLLGDAQQRNFLHFPLSKTEAPDRDFYGENAYMREWIKKRIEWMDTATNSAENLRRLSCDDESNPESFLFIGGTGIEDCGQISAGAQGLAGRIWSAARARGSEFVVLDGNRACKITDAGASAPEGQETTEKEKPAAGNGNGGKFFALDGRYSLYVFLENGDADAANDTEQKAFLSRQIGEFNKGNRTHLFIFMNRPVFVQGIVAYANLSRLADAVAGMEGNDGMAFDAQMMPFLKTVNMNRKRAYVISDGLGAGGGLFYDNYAGIDSVVSSLDGKGEGLALEVKAYPKKASLVPIRMADGQPAGEIRDFSKEAWK
ncbi:MAG: CotH kinase family protein [Pseudomonadota bacterium]